MPESFDSLLAELADAACDAVGLPDPAAVRRRARQRTVRHRMVVSALVIVLFAVSGGTFAAVQGRFGARESVGPAGGAGTAPAANGANAVPGTAPGSAAPGPSASAAGTSGVGSSAGAGVGPSYSAFFGVWKDDPTQDGYLMVFPDGVAALSEPDGFPLCYARLGGATSSALFASAGTSALAASLKDATCSKAVGETGLTLSDPQSSTTLTLSIPTTAKGSASASASANADATGSASTTNGTSGGTASTETGTAPGTASTATYARVLAMSAETSSGAVAAKTLARLVGSWSSVDSTHRDLEIGKSGTVQYSWLLSTANFTDGSGTIDEYTSVGVRVATACPSGMSGSICGVLLIEQGSSADQIIVYGSYGPETFTRVD